MLSCGLSFSSLWVLWAVSIDSQCGCQIAGQKRTETSNTNINSQNSINEHTETQQSCRAPSSGHNPSILASISCRNSFRWLPHGTQISLSNLCQLSCENVYPLSLKSKVQRESSSILRSSWISVFAPSEIISQSCS